MAPVPSEVHQRIFQEQLPEGKKQEEALEANNNNETRKLVGIDGYWYDVTNFVDRHPGGPVIEHFIGKDASTIFHAYGHSDLLLKHRKPVGTYTREYKHPSDQDFHRLLLEFKQKGYFKTDWNFYLRKFAVCAIQLAIVFFLVCAFEEWYWHYAGAVMLSLFWEQSGFLMHDFMHIQVFRNNFWDRFAGTFFGTVCFGPSAHWWKDDHDIHHSVTNMVDVPKEFLDPQSFEGLWAQNPKMFSFYRSAVQRFFIKIQHITFLPAVVFLGRVGILIDSYKTERRWYQWLAFALHWTWVIFLLSFLPTWREVIIFYTIASWFEGSLHVKLLISHYSKQFLMHEEFHSSSWFQHQLQATMNIANPPCMDWFFGGLNLHIEHHFFPKLARSRFREASQRIREICKRHGLHYDSVSFLTAIWRTLVGLKKSSIHFSLDPR